MQADGATGGIAGGGGLGLPGGLGGGASEQSVSGYGCRTARPVGVIEPSSQHSLCSEAALYEASCVPAMRNSKNTVVRFGRSSHRSVGIGAKPGQVLGRSPAVTYVGPGRISSRQRRL